MVLKFLGPLAQLLKKEILNFRTYWTQKMLPFFAAKNVRCLCSVKAPHIFFGSKYYHNSFS